MNLIFVGEVIFLPIKFHRGIYFHVNSVTKYLYSIAISFLLSFICSLESKTFSALLKQRAKSETGVVYFVFVL